MSNLIDDEGEGSFCSLLGCRLVSLKAPWPYRNHDGK